jgi:hypothetical protein
MILRFFARLFNGVAGLVYRWVTRREYGKRGD